jgi:PiT family inorganic phosphate transporter
MPHIEIVFILSIIFGAYMAWNIGANDVANAFGTSVGSKALTIGAAVMLAAVFEFAGAFFVGGHVTQTIRSGMFDISVVSAQPVHFAIGMTAALLAAAIWLNLATHWGWPVSTTHSIVGAVVGFGLVIAGVSAINWSKVGQIAMSWVVSPLVGGLLAVAIYLTFVLPIYRSREPAKLLRRLVPLATGLVFFLLTLSMVFKGLKNLKLNFTFIEASFWGLVIASIAAAITYLIVKRIPLKEESDPVKKFKQTEPVFAVLQIITASYTAFAHGANDVANAVGPLAAVHSVWKAGGLSVSESATVPNWILLLGGLGIVVGLATYGYRVMATIGKKITTISPSRGFAAEFGAATTVLICTRLSLPVSTTHTLVGAVVGVGLVRGMRSLDMKVVRDIGASWLYTIPFTAALTAGIFWVMLQFLG